MKKLLMIVLLLTAVNGKSKKWNDRFYAKMDTCAEKKIANNNTSCLKVGFDLAEKLGGSEMFQRDTAYLCATACIDPEFYYSKLRE